MAIYANPWRQLRSEMDSLFREVVPSALEDWWPNTVRGQPAVNLWDRGEELLVEMEVPGAKQENIDVSVTGDELTIKVDRPDLEQQGVTYHRRERPTGSFTRVLQLPCTVNTQRVEADLLAGVLTIRLPKAETTKPRKINVAGG
ncbi:MAG: Hsp20/alpha crystallin family protein [Thermoguttaceae bacterium]